MKLEKNVIFYDRVLKLFVGTAVFLYGLFWQSGYLQILLMVFSLIPLGVAVVGSCPLYKVVGFCLIDKRKYSTSEKYIIASVYLIFVFAFIYISIKYR